MAVDLVVKFVSGAACAVPQRAPALDHEILDDTVECQAVIERLSMLHAINRVSPFFGACGKAGEIGNCLRRIIVEELNSDIAEGSMEYSFHSDPLCSFDITVSA